MEKGTEGKPVAQLTRDEQVVAYFVRKCASKKSLGRTQLMKLAYLADHEARRYLGRPLSDMSYYWHFFGPYDDQILSTIKSLGEKDVVQESTIVYPTGQKGFEYKSGTAAQVTTTLSPIEIQVLHFVCSAFADMKLSTLLSDVVYETAPMKAAIAAKAQGQPLKMDMVNGTKRNEYAISFEELFDRIQEVRAGRGVPHADAVAQVWARLAPPANAAA
jgi:uncharacterized phage-associated protein